MSSALKVWDGTKYVTIAGVKGDAATVSAGTTTTGAEGTNASVVNSGTVNAAIFDFTIPRGDQGIQGIQGLSAYEVAVNNGFSGTEQEWLDSMQDVLFYLSTAGFPATGITDQIYVAEDTGYMYWWNDTVYVQLTGEIYTTAEQTKLSGIESGATADQTASEIKTAYESNADTNAYTDNEKTKLSGIETGATADQTASEILTSIKTVDGTTSGLDADLLDGLHSTAFATSAQGTLADSAVQPGDLSTVATSGSYNDLLNKPDLSVLEEVNVYTSEANFPATGETAKVYIAEDTGYMYRWNGTSYTQLTDQTAIWGQVSGTLADQTDLQTALDGKAASSHSHLAGDLPATIMYEGENISLLNNDSAYITSAGAPVQSVNTQTGAVVLSTTDIGEGTNLYYTDARARASISATGDISYSSATGVISFNETYSTAAEVKTAYESNTDTNAFTDALQTKLNGIEASADNYASWTISDGTNTEAILSGNSLIVSGSGATTSSYNATNNTLTISSTDTTYTGGTGITLTGTTFSLTDEVYTSTEKTKLSGIETGATADQTATEIKTAYESNTDTNAFTDSEKTKLASVALPVPPTLNTPTSGTEGDELTITITNYDATFVYYVGTQAGEVTRNGNTITWTLPYVDANTDYDIIVHAVDPASQMYAVTVDTVTVGDIPLIADDAVIITAFGSSSYNNGWIV